MLARGLCREAIAAQGSADALELVGDDGDADAGTTDDDAALALAALDRARDLGGIVRIVDRIGAIGAKVLVLEATLVQVRLDLLEKLVSAVVTAQSNHVSSFPQYRSLARREVPARRHPMVRPLGHSEVVNDQHCPCRAFAFVDVRMRRVSPDICATWPIVYMRFPLHISVITLDIKSGLGSTVRIVRARSKHGRRSPCTTRP